MSTHPNGPRILRTSTRRGAATMCAATLVGLTAAGAAWATTPTTAHTKAAPRTCAASELYLSMGRQEGAAGSLYWPIQFTNTSTTSCALRGYPGVSALDTAHHQIGPAAAHSGTSYGTVTLAPGHSASAVVRTTNGPVGGPCLRTGAYLRVYPPASRTAILVPAPWKTCSGVFRTGPVNTEGAI
ncbi:DUF4232 domain-containing protein [Streptomyces sp. NPDC015171]|uniref:DUF4232 domain-containing protein n=1 Tax=Streptomyces sp. NPDC015171 TaxID=3364945 RepID=UPI0036FCA0E2